MTPSRWVGDLGERSYFWVHSLLLVGSAGLGLFAGREFEMGDWSRYDYVLFAAFVAAGAAAVIVPSLRDSGQRNAIVDYRAKSRTDYGDALDVAIDKLGELVNARGKENSSLHGQALALLLNAACELTGPAQGRLRATFFNLVEGCEGDPDRLEPVLSAGRSRPSTFTFRGGSVIGDDALQMVREREFLLVTDAVTSPPEHWRPNKNVDYVAFLSVTCGIQKEPVGMLTIDSTSLGDIDKDDIATLVLIGRLIAVAYRLKA